jgi:hypothetical protein
MDFSRRPTQKNSLFLILDLSHLQKGSTPENDSFAANEHDVSFSTWLGDIQTLFYYLMRSVLSCCVSITGGDWSKWRNWCRKYWECWKRTGCE